MRHHHLPSLMGIDSRPSSNRNGSAVEFSGAPVNQPFGLRRTLLGILAGAVLAFAVDLAVDLPALFTAWLS